MDFQWGGGRILGELESGGVRWLGGPNQLSLNSRIADQRSLNSRIAITKQLNSRIADQRSLNSITRDQKRRSVRTVFELCSLMPLTSRGRRIYIYIYIPTQVQADHKFFTVRSKGRRRRCRPRLCPARRPGSCFPKFGRDLGTLCHDPRH